MGRDRPWRTLTFGSDRSAEEFPETQERKVNRKQTVFRMNGWANRQNAGFKRENAGAVVSAVAPAFFLYCGHPAGVD